MSYSNPMHHDRGLHPLFASILAPFAPPTIGIDMSLSNTILRVRLPSGHQAVYELQPQHLNEIMGMALEDRAICFGKQLAHQHGNRWYKAGGWDEINDPRTLELLETATEAV